MESMNNENQLNIHSFGKYICVSIMPDPVPDFGDLEVNKTKFPSPWL